MHTDSKQTVISSKGNTNKRKKFIFFYVVIVLCCFIPYEFCSVYLRFLPEKTHYTAFAFISLTILVGFYLHSLQLNRVVFRMWAIQMFGLGLAFAVHGTILPFFGVMLSGLLAMLLVSLVDKGCGLLYFQKRYNKWILIIAVLGVVTAILILFVGISPISAAPDKGDGRIIYNYLLSFSKYDMSSAIGFRYSGFFDEPGAMAYWGLFALIFNRLFFANKRYEYLLTFLLLLTFSLGFIVQLALYYFLFYLLKLKNKFQIVLLVLLVAGLVLGAKQLEGTDLDFIYQITYKRIEQYNEESSYSGSVVSVGNRADLSAKALQVFKSNPLFGSKLAGEEYMGDNIYEPLAYYGIVGTFFFLYPFIWLLLFAIKKKNFDVLKVWIVLVAGFVHRPFHPLVLYFFTIYILILMLHKGLYIPFDKGKS